jgi:hypothetical protein
VQARHAGGVDRGAAQGCARRDPDGTPLVANAVDYSDPNVVDEQVIVGAGFGTINWGDGYGPEPDAVFGLQCEIPEAEDLLRTRPDRLRRRAGTQ